MATGGGGVGGRVTVPLILNLVQDEETDMEFTPRPLYHQKITKVTIGKGTVDVSGNMTTSFPNGIRTPDHPACGLFATSTSLPLLLSVNHEMILHV